MAKVQKTYTREFKEEAVRLAQTSGKPIAQVARELGISDTSIHQWRKDLTEHSAFAFPEGGNKTGKVGEGCRAEPGMGDGEEGARQIKKLLEESLRDNLIER